MKREMRCPHESKISNCFECLSGLYSTTSSLDINLCKSCGTAKHLNADGYCGRCSLDWLDEILQRMQSEQADLSTRYFKREIKDTLTLTDLRKLVVDEAKQAITTHITEQLETACNEARINELEHMDTYRHYGKDYQDSLDELADYKENRIDSLQSSRDPLRAKGTADTTDMKGGE